MQKVEFASQKAASQSPTPQPQQTSKSKPLRKAAATKTHCVSSEEVNTERLVQDIVLHVGNNRGHSDSIILIGQALVFNPQTETLEKVHVMLDSGADRSFISNDLADRLKLPVTEATVLEINTFGSSTPLKKKCGKTRVKLWDRNGIPHSYSVTRIDVLTEPICRSSLTLEDKKFLDENDIALSISPKTTEVRADILLGCADLFTLMGKDVGEQRTLPSGLKILPSKLGYLVIGKTENDHRSIDASGSRTETNNLLQTIVQNETQAATERELETTVIPTPFDSQSADLESPLGGIEFSESSSTDGEHTCVDFNREDNETMWEKFYSFETSGVQEFIGPMARERQETNDMVMKEFEATIQKKEDGYHVRLPWKKDGMDLPDNKAMSFRRLQAIVTKLRKDPNLMQQYHDTFMKQLQLGIIEEVTKDTARTSTRIHYLAHQAVLTPHKETTKLRVVFDASAHMRGCPSLNDVLHQGPVLLPLLFDMLLRFRIASIALISDVEKAFLQVRLQNEDRDATRFLWLRDITMPVTSENLVTYRFTRVTFGLNCSPFLLAGTIHYHLQFHEDRKFAQTLWENIYVDNVVLTAESAENAFLLYTKAKDLFQELQMNLREFRSNNRDLNNRIPESDISKNPLQKVLGILWNTESDKLVLDCSYPARTRYTKRTVSEQVASVYDPHGWLTPLTLPAKLFFQELWTHEYDWDALLSTEHQERWRKIQESTNGFKKQLSRKVGNLDEPATIVLFADASSQAMAACAYIVQHEESELLAGRCKLPRLKDKPTIPKMEFHALTMATRLAHSIVNALRKRISVTSVHILTDSEIALSWIGSTAKGKSAGVFINNRRMEIHQLVKDIPVATTFGYVKTSENPADGATRGIQKEEFNQHFWWRGPNFITKPPTHWDKEYKTFSLLNHEEEREDENCIVSITTTTSQPSNLLDWKRHESLESCKTAIAYALRFIKGITSRVNADLRQRVERNIPEISHVTTKPYVTAREREMALRLLVKNHQRVHVTGPRRLETTEITPRRQRDLAVQRTPRKNEPTL